MTPPRDLRPGEIVVVLALLAFSLAALHQAHGIAGFSGLATGGVMPMLAAGIMVVSGLAILRDALSRRRASQKGARGPTLAESFAFLVPARVLIFSVLLVLYAAVMPWIGFLPASGGFLFLSIAFLWRRGLLKSAMIAVASVLAVHVIFRLVFQVVLPAGSLWR